MVIVLILLCALSYAAFEIFAGLAAGNVDQWLAAVMYNGVGTLLPLAIYVSIGSKGKTTPKGIFLALAAGVAILVFSVLLARVFNKGGNISYVIPLVYGVAMVLSSIFGMLVLKERASVLQIAGIGLIVLGVATVGLAKFRHSA